MERWIHILVAFVISAPVIGQWDYEVRKAKIDPVGDDYAPVLLDSMIVMCSMRDGNHLVKVEQEDTGKPLSDMYWIPYARTSKDAPVLFDERFTTELNDGPASFTQQGRVICFTQNIDAGKKLGKATRGSGALGLFISYRTEVGWSEQEPFPFNSEEYSVVHPTFNAAGDQLIFASDQPGGLGGMDLYASTLRNGRWSRPANLGPEVNSTFNEVFPFLHANGTLYYASSREGGLGGLDIYKADQIEGSWTIPLPLPEPINSSANDLGYTSFDTDIAGAFSSDRDGGDAIYLFSKTVPRFIDPQPQQENNYCYKFDAPRVQDLAGLPLRYEWNMGDGTMLLGTHVSHCYTEPGDHVVQLQVIDTTSQMVFFTEAEFALSIDDVHQPYIEMVDSVRTGRWVSMNASQTYLPELFIENMRWSLGDGTFGEGMHHRHKFGKEGAYTVSLDVLGIDLATGKLVSRSVTKEVHVLDRFRDLEDAPVLASYQDAAGTKHEFTYQSLPFDQYTLAVKEGEDASFTIELFASKERISVDDPMFAEIRKFYPIIERYDPERGRYTYSVGEAKTLAEMYDIYVKVKQLQFLDAEVMALNVEKVMDLSQLAMSAIKDLNNTVVRSSTVFFETNKATIAQEFERSLQQLTDLLVKHNEVRLVIEAHTDSRGKEVYNQELSDLRAEALVDYFAKHGIGRERMVSMGHGETRPIADNGTAAGRSQNRRVEFRLSTPREDQALQMRSKP